MYFQIGDSMQSAGTEFIERFLQKYVNKVTDKRGCGHITIVCPHSYYTIKDLRNLPEQDIALLQDYEGNNAGHISWEVTVIRELPCLRYISIRFDSMQDCEACKPCSYCSKRDTCVAKSLEECPFEICSKCKGVYEKDFGQKPIPVQIDRKP